MQIWVQDYIQDREDEGTRTEWSPWDHYSLFYTRVTVGLGTERSRLASRPRRSGQPPPPIPSVGDSTLEPYVSIKALRVRPFWDLL